MREVRTWNSEDYYCMTFQKSTSQVTVKLSKTMLLKLLVKLNIFTLDVVSLHSVLNSFWPLPLSESRGLLSSWDGALSENHCPAHAVLSSFTTWAWPSLHASISCAGNEKFKGISFADRRGIRLPGNRSTTGLVKIPHRLVDLPIASLLGEEHISRVLLLMPLFFRRFSDYWVLHHLCSRTASSHLLWSNCQILHSLTLPSILIT